MYEDFVVRKSARKQSVPTRGIAALIAIFVTLLIVFLKPFMFPQREETVTSPVVTPSPKTEVRGAFNPFGFLFDSSPKNAKTEEDLLVSIKELLAKEKGFYSVYVFDLIKGTGYGINETTILTAASVNKVPILAALYYLAQKEEIDLDERITLQQKDIQDFGTGILRYEGAGSVYSLKSLAQILIKKSDNTAGYVLGEQTIGFPKIQELVESWGMIQTDMVNNKTSNKDMALLFAKMYKGQVANQAYTAEMLGFLKDTDFENRLPRDIPKNISVHHKIGNEVGNIHDVGVVALADHPYYIGIMTNDIIDIERTEEVIAIISKVVFDFYSNQK